ncbi:hypothetical protein B0H14DRAFT_3143602 [Mycena olivaceomarginata]|nr:hypothetical protein B0H14DRAFT_3143602 [Mycena olivaceomarginata]
MAIHENRLGITSSMQVPYQSPRKETNWGESISGMVDASPNPEKTCERRQPVVILTILTIFTIIVSKIVVPHCGGCDRIYGLLKRPIGALVLEGRVKRGSGGVCAKGESHGSSCVKGRLGDGEALDIVEAAAGGADCDDGDCDNGGHGLRDILRAGGRGTGAMDYGFDYEELALTTTWITFWGRELETLRSQGLPGPEGGKEFLFLGHRFEGVRGSESQEEARARENEDGSMAVKAKRPAVPVSLHQPIKEIDMRTDLVLMAGIRGRVGVGRH